MSSSAKKTNKSSSLHKKSIAIAAGVILALWLAIDAIGIGGNIRFYAKWLECGQKPVVEAIDSIGPDYGPFYYHSPPTFSLFRLSPDQFCTPIEAERSGLSAEKNNWRFPHLEAAGEENPFLKDLKSSQ